MYFRNYENAIEDEIVKENAIYRIVLGILFVILTIVYFNTSRLYLVDLMYIILQLFLSAFLIDKCINNDIECSIYIFPMIINVIYVFYMMS